MIFAWLKRRRRDRLFAQPLPEEWRETIERNVAHFGRLSDSEQAKLLRNLRVFVAEKNWEGCGGLKITDEIKVTIAAQACLLVLGFDEEHFDAVKSILVYPNAYVAPDRTITRGGLVIEGESSREGEAWYRGPVILSWADALEDGRRESGGGNLVLHEFAHQLDMQSGSEINGTPPLASPEEYQRWRRVMRSEFRRLRHDCRSHRPTLLDCYGATNIGEFFAVATECFFQQSGEMSRQLPRLYELLHHYYRPSRPQGRTALGRQVGR